MKKKFNVLFFIHIFLLYLTQTKPPESYSLIRGVNESINMNSGTINLDIPLFDITEGKFKLTNNLKYDSRGFVPYITPGYVGLNWSMVQLGKITREAHRIDLTTSSDLNDRATTSGVVGLRILPNYNTGMYYEQYDCLTTKVIEDKKSIFNHNVESHPKSYDLNSSTSYTKTDINFEPDKFYFDFMGYKGYFAMDNNGKIIVFCEDASLKVDVTNYGFHNIFENIVFSEIKITDDKGNQYFFGGGVETLDINYSFNNISYRSYHPSWGPNTGSASTKTNYIDGWLLKRVIFSDGTEVNAYYQPTNLTILNNYRSNGAKGLEFQVNPQYDPNPNFPPKQNIINNNLTAELVENFTYYDHSVYVPDNYLDNQTYTNVSTLTKKAVLDSISYRNVVVDYKYDLTTNPLEISGKYLREINVKRNSKLIKKITLNYQNFGATNQRTFLTDIHNNLGESYTMEYTNIDDFPKYIIGQANDLGFWNGDMRNYGEYNGQIKKYEEAAPDDLTAFDTGLLKKIIYPTKGSTSYIYEHGTYSKKNTYTGVEGLSDEIGITNSPRLSAKIETNNNQSLQTLYTYQKDDGLSSGIIEGTEKYQYFSGTAALSNQNLNQNLNSQNSLHYSIVKEIVSNKGFKKYTYSDRITNGDSLTNKIYDLNTFSHNLVFNPQHKFYLSKASERGKILREEIYDNNNTKIKETVYKYKKFLEKLPSITVTDNNCSNCKVSDINYYTKVKHYRGINFLQTMYVPITPYLLSSQTIREYFGGKIFETTKNTTYLDKVLKRYSEGSSSSNDYVWYPYPKEEKSITSLDTSIKKFLYPIDLYNENPCFSCTNDNTIVGGQYSAYQQLHYRNIFTPIIEISKNTQNKFLLTENLFSPTSSTTSGAYAITNVKKSLVDATLDFMNYKIPVNKTENNKIFDLYDNKLNLLQETSKFGIPTTTLWGYNQTLPIAKIEGASYSQVMEAFGLSSTDNNSYLQLAIVNKSNADIDEASESDFLLELNSFRNKNELKSFKITTYSYNPLIGVTNITPSSGVHESYKYDNSNRLMQVLNNENNILKEYSYNYTPVKYFNILKSKSFVKNDCVYDEYGSTYNYIVPANKYMSIINQADADQKAQNEIDIHGQNTANINGICGSPAFCSFNPENDINGVTSTIERLSDIKVRVQINIPISLNGLNSSNSTLPLQGFFIGEIADGCQLISSSNQLMAIENGRKWIVTMGINGSIYIKLFEGAISPSSTSAGSINLNFEYNINDSNSI